MERIRVLIADSEEIFRKAVAGYLENAPNIKVVATCSAGLETIRKAIELKPDVILLDKYIENCGFIEVRQRIKAKLPGTRVIVVQPYRAPNTLSALDAEADAYTDKGTPVEVLPRIIEHVHQGESHLPPYMAARLLEEVYLSRRKGEDRVPLGSDAVLSIREIEVLTLIAEKGATNKEIGNILFISEGTVKAHVRRIMEKLHIHSRLQAAVLAREKHLTGTKTRDDV